MTQQSLALQGVHHSARPTWKLAETVEFYGDTLGLPLVHAVSARGWGPNAHPDFLHFFFESGSGTTIAFFYYLGHPQPGHLVHRAEFDNDAEHTAWKVNTKEELSAWKTRLQSRGVEILYEVEHEVIESIYFRDPNGYLLEITRPLRPFTEIDAVDAQLTLASAIAIETASRNGSASFSRIEPVWRAKGDALDAMMKGAS